jgi:hypothetical protein
MSESKMGAIVQYCGHDGWFIADIHRVENVNVIYASRPVTMENLNRPAEDCTHHITDFPVGGFWKPQKGIFVIPEAQCKALSGNGAPKQGKEFVASILPEVVCSDEVNGWMILAAPGAKCALLSGAKTEVAAWNRAARMLGCTAY